MKRFLVIVYLAPLLVFLSYGTFAQQSVPPAANVNGTYVDLLQTLPCPQDKGKYGEFNDYGFYAGGSWCGQAIKSGWWVYVYPNWYVWNKNTKMPPPHPGEANVDGKYSNLTKSIICPKDKGEYGEFKDYGYWGDLTTYCGQPVPKGFWVYKYPYWYIWKDKK